jgi:hypothetical protein
VIRGREALVAALYAPSPGRVQVSVAARILEDLAHAENVLGLCEAAPAAEKLSRRWIAKRRALRRGRRSAKKRQRHWKSSLQILVVDPLCLE